MEATTVQQTQEKRLDKEIRDAISRHIPDVDDLQVPTVAVMVMKALQSRGIRVKYNKVATRLYLMRGLPVPAATFGKKSYEAPPQQASGEENGSPFDRPAVIAEPVHVSQSLPTPTPQLKPEEALAIDGAIRERFIRAFRRVCSYITNQNLEVETLADYIKARLHRFGLPSVSLEEIIRLLKQMNWQSHTAFARREREAAENRLRSYWVFPRRSTATEAESLFNFVVSHYSPFYVSIQTEAERLSNLTRKFTRDEIFAVLSSLPNSQISQYLIQGSATGEVVNSKGEYRVIAGDRRYRDLYDLTPRH
jgi:hypothetical protein